jgi:hypothetical protein
MLIHWKVFRPHRYSVVQTHVLTNDGGFANDLNN